MALEEIGSSESLKKLVIRIKERFPDYNFDVPAPPDTKCKAPGLCSPNSIRYYENDGNIYCGQRYKLVEESNIHKWNWATCNALVVPVDNQKKYKDLQDEAPF